MNNENRHIVSQYYTAHRDELLAYVSGRLNGSGSPEDIVQDVFVRLLTTDKMISVVTLPALAYTVARNLVGDYYRRHASRQEYEHFLTRRPGCDDSVESVISASQLTEIMERGLARVPEDCREIYRLHVYGGMKVGEISRQLGQGYKSVEYRLGLARHQVRRYMAKVV